MSSDYPYASLDYMDSNDGDCGEQPITAPHNNSAATEDGRTASGHMSNRRRFTTLRNHDNYSEAVELNPLGPSKAVDQIPTATSDKPKAISTKTKKVDRAGSWAWEIAGAVFSFICIALLIGFLGRVNGMVYAHWQYSISPNSVISVIAAFTKAAMLIPVSTCLGQLKWKQGQSQTSTPIYHFHVLDQASRGPWGSLEVIWRIRSGLAIAWAALMVLSVAFDPFAQMILAFPSREILTTNQTAYAHQAQEYFPDWTYKYTLSQSMLDPTMQTALLTGLAGINSPLEPTCPSTHCTYPDFATLGICTECQDITNNADQSCHSVPRNSSLWKEDFSVAMSPTSGTGFGDNPSEEYLSTPLNCTYAFPNGFDFTPDIRYAVEDLSEHYIEIARVPLTSVPSNNPRMLGVTPGLMFSFFTSKFTKDLIYTPDNTTAFDQKPTMTNCSIYWCEKQYTQNQFLGNGPHNPSVRTQPLNVTRWGTEWSVPWELAPVNGAQSFSKNSTYSVEYLTFGIVSSMMHEFFNDSFIPRDGNTMQGIHSSGILYDSDNITKSLEGMATSMTDHIRTSNKANQIGGWVYRNETFIQVRWPWIILPVASVLLSILLFASTAVSCRGQTVLWKSSVLPLMMGQLEISPEHDIGPLLNVDEIQSVSKRINIRVDDSDQNSLRFVEQ